MAELNQVYKCNVCGNMTELVHSGTGEMVCCGQPMELVQAKSEEEGTEKHQPTIEKTDIGMIVRVGSVAHPMTAEHYIEWIELITEHRTYRKQLEPGDEPMAEFCLEAEHAEARAYCNVHGLWKN